MKNFYKLKYFAMLLVVALASFSFASCSDDEDDDSPSSSLVGQWYDVDSEAKGCRDVHMVVFNANGKGAFFYQYRESGEKHSIDKFSWKVDSDGIVCFYDWSLEYEWHQSMNRVRYKLSDAKLTFYRQENGDWIKWGVFKRVN